MRGESGDPKGGKGRRRGRGRPRGSARLNQRGQTVVDARLQNIVDGIDISETQRQLLEEEADDHQQSLDEATATHEDEASEETSEVVEEDMSRSSAFLGPRKDPPGEPIPQFTIQSWKASWRRAFFTDWRWSPKRKEGEAQVWARCNTGECKTKTKPHYYAGGTSSFTNFEKNLISCHNEEYKQYNPVLSMSKDPSQPSLLSFNVHSVKTKKQRQIKLDTELAFSIAVDNIPLNILRRPRFRQWVEV